MTAARALPQDLAPAPSIDPVWSTLIAEARALVAREPLLTGFVHRALLDHPSFEAAIAARIAEKLAGPDFPALLLRDLASEAFAADPTLGRAARRDVTAVRERDPACRGLTQPVLFFKGFQALQGYRVAHWCWRAGRQDLALALQMRISEVFAVDIHPAARVGAGVMIDHATGVVIGETAVVGDNVSILQGVTLGGTGKETGDRHPKIGAGVLIGANASILGNITVGACSRVGAGSVVLAPVPPCTTVVGVPARVVGDGGCPEPALGMDHTLPPEALAASGAVSE